MLDILKEISGTSVPNILMGLGSLLILLAFVQKIGTYMELPKERQKVAAVAGTVFLGLGIGITVSPHLTGGTPSAFPFESPAQDVKEKPIPSSNSRETTAASANIAEPNGTEEVSSSFSSNASEDAEPTFAGKLESLMPDIGLLPEDMRFFSRSTIDIDKRFEFSGKPEAEVKRLLRQANYQGLEVRYDSLCGSRIPPGEVRHAVFGLNVSIRPRKAGNTGIYQLTDLRSRSSEKTIGRRPITHTWANPSKNAGLLTRLWYGDKFSWAM